MRKLLSLLILLTLSISCADEKQIIFNSEKWKNGSLAERGNMSTNLVESKILIGKNKSDVINLLGYPNDSSLTNFHYLLDFGYMTNFDLDIIFDSNSHNVNEAIISD